MIGTIFLVINNYKCEDVKSDVWLAYFFETWNIPTSYKCSNTT